MIKESFEPCCDRYIMIFNQSILDESANRRPSLIISISKIDQRVSSNTVTHRDGNRKMQERGTQQAKIIKTRPGNNYPT